MLTDNPGDFRLIRTCRQTKARAGELLTAHGAVPTPVFLPVASQGSVKTLTPQEVSGIGLGMVLANTYHLYLRPGRDVITGLGGLHKFMGWPGALLTDSGGYQVFSLAPLRRVDDGGVTFRSHIDGSEHRFTPETVVELQEALGADIIMVLDECPAYGESREKVREATDRTHRWAERCLGAWQQRGQALYAIVQGGVFPELRRESARHLAAMDFPGYALGGLSLGEPKKETLDLIGETVPWLPEAKLRYLMGVGSPEDIVEAVARGCDIFDSALPTRVARNGALFTGAGRLNIHNAVYSRQEAPIDPGCDCYTCRNFSAAYLRHLFHSGELLAYRLATIHNLSFIRCLMEGIRTAILEDSFASFRERFVANYRPTDEAARLSQKRQWLQRSREGG